uniref:Endonuclease III n=1 Tax=Steinernema glaseri TaxID=37863 RepID=A0A1I8ATK0_9BILA
MFSEVALFLIHIVLSLLGTILLLRAWVYALRIHPFNPYSQAMFKVTDWLVMPLRRVIKSGNHWDWTSLVAAWLSALVYLVLSAMVLTGSVSMLSNFPMFLLAAVFTVLRWTLSLIFWVVLLQALLSWIQPQSPSMPLLRSITAPLLDPIRRVLPDLGGLDLSPLVILLLTQVLNMVITRTAFSLSKNQGVLSLHRLYTGLIIHQQATVMTRLPSKPDPASRYREAEQFLAALDPDWQALVAHVGPCIHQPRPERDPYEALIRSVVYQQLHTRAAERILQRLINIYPHGHCPTPEEARLDGIIPDQATALQIPDEDLIKQLTTLRGIGRWTVEMMMMYTLEHEDILPADDFGV